MLNALPNGARVAEWRQIIGERYMIPGCLNGCHIELKSADRWRHHSPNGQPALSIDRLDEIDVKLHRIS